MLRNKKYENHVMGTIADNVDIGFNTFIGPEVVIKENCKIGCNTVIDGQVVIESGNYIGNNSVIHGPTFIGEKNFISDFVSIGCLPEHTVYRYELKETYEYKDKRIIIGNNNIIRQYALVHLPTISRTEIKDNCIIGAYSGISHDSVLYEGVVITANIMVGGHSILLPYAYIGLTSTIHQRSTIGSFVMTGMGSVITQDISPAVIALGIPAKLWKFNQVGLERNKISQENIDAFKSFYRILKRKGTISASLMEINNEFVLKHMKEFMTYKNKSRSLASFDYLEV